MSDTSARTRAMLTVDMVEAMGAARVTIKVKRLREARVRAWLAAVLLRLAAKIAPCIRVVEVGLPDSEKTPEKGSFTCAACREEFETDWTDDEAVEEFEEAFGTGFDPDDTAKVCDDCYRRVVAEDR